MLTFFRLCSRAPRTRTQPSHLVPVLLPYRLLRAIIHDDRSFGYQTDNGFAATTIRPNLKALYHVSRDADQAASVPIISFSEASESGYQQLLATTGT